jgi:oligopeptide/dipeptide ABC transporter ATP-binding protein
VSLLQVRDLHTHFISRNLDNEIRIATALNGVSFEVSRGEVLGLVGETGAGKSLTAYSVMNLLKPPAQVVGGVVEFDGRNLRDLETEDMNKLRGSEIAMVVQNPRSSLDPLTRIGEQLVRVHTAHTDTSESAARARAIEMLGAVGIPAPEQRMRAWPHELSGGMAQRVLIAMALMNEPKLIIADEPTTGLDVTVQAQILDLLRELVETRNVAAMVITHDLGIVAHYCDRMAVMFAGRIVETGAVETVFDNPAHPYTRTLIASTPERLRETKQKILGGGAPPNLYNLPPGCHYVERCQFADDSCNNPLVLEQVGDGHFAMCARMDAVREGWPS